MNFNTITLMPFVPCRDFALSQAFYLDLGFERVFAEGDLARMQVGETAFMLQDFYVKECAESLMLHLQVEDVRAWHTLAGERISAARYPEPRLSPLTVQPWKQLDFTLQDPSGVCWRIAQNLPAA